MPSTRAKADSTAAAADAQKEEPPPRKRPARAPAAKPKTGEKSAAKPKTGKKSAAAASHKGPTREHEARLWAKGHRAVAGVDEAGRGPLAGPVVAAACVLPPFDEDGAAARGALPPFLAGLDDSKKLDEPAREALYAAITSHPGVAWCVRVEDHRSVDRVNILQATMLAMRRAVEGLSAEESGGGAREGAGGGGAGRPAAAGAREGAGAGAGRLVAARAGGGDSGSGIRGAVPKGLAADEAAPLDPAASAADVAALPDPSLRRSRLRLAPSHALVDGNRIPAGLPCPAEAVVRGDGKVAAIAAASVIAKVTRDRIMLQLGARHPGYNLAQNKGYGVPSHLEAVRRLGPSEVHRRSFEPVRSMVGWTRECMLAREAEEQAQAGAEAEAEAAAERRREEAEAQAGRRRKGAAGRGEGPDEAAAGGARSRGGATKRGKKRAAPAVAGGDKAEAEEEEEADLDAGRGQGGGGDQQRPTPGGGRPRPPGAAQAGPRGAARPAKRGASTLATGAFGRKRAALVRPGED